ncbi:hypothetical protein [Syntrophomonas palmitatica]|uniref:hypothetical protein n=1 Tax=Syntrophomonas palmitatica TaxID=402877 RepID=UPI0006D06F44|nr:hypothetical protein [Syntrophomonas palmitatica]
MKALKIHIQGIKCDNPTCDYRNPTVEFKDYEKWINKPCPLCGANLLTEEDIKAIKRLYRTANWINWILRPFIKTDAPRAKVAAEMNGTGKLKFTTIEKI